MVTRHVASAIKYVCRAVALLIVCVPLPGIRVLSVNAMHETNVITTNPYSAKFGPPNCTWYAWQRLHDVERIDFQFAPNADQWAVLAARPQAFWSERTNSYIQAQINSTPAPGDILVLPVSSAYAHPYHVAFVETGLDANGNFLVTQQSYGDTNISHANAKPYPWTYPSTQNLQAMQTAENGQASFIHFPSVTVPPQPVDGATTVQVSANQTVQTNQQFSISFTEQNAGTTTWSDSSGYQLVCLLYCMGASSVGFGGNNVASGQQWKFAISLTSPAATGTYVTVWAMEHNGTQFGDGPGFVVISVKILPGGLWISPANSQTVGDVIHFAAHAYPTHPGDPQIDHVNFTIGWQGASSWKVACTVHPPTTGDSYKCDANLKQLGVPYGQIQVSFDVYNKLGNVNFAPNGVHTMSYVSGGNMAGFSQFVGTWKYYGTIIIINADGTATYIGRTHVFCSDDPRPPCDGGNLGLDGLNTTILFIRVNGNTAFGVIKGGTGDRDIKGNILPVGSAINVTLVSTGTLQISDGNGPFLSCTDYPNSFACISNT